MNILGYLTSKLSKYSTNELSEQVITEYLIETNKTSDCSMIDIGAAPPPNYYPIFMRHAENVYCVEPALTTKGNPFKSNVKKLLRLSRQGKLKLFKGVISDVSGQVTFHQGIGNTINSSLNPSFRLDSIEDVPEYMESFNPITVESLTYADYIKQNKIGELLFVKVDVEGAESRVLSTINRSNSPKILLLEVAYETVKLKEQVHRMMANGTFAESLFISRKHERHNSDVVGEYHFNEVDLPSGSLFLSRNGVINKEEILNLRQEIMGRIRYI